MWKSAYIIVGEEGWETCFQNWLDEHQDVEQIKFEGSTAEIFVLYKEPISA